MADPEAEAEGIRQPENVSLGLFLDIIESEANPETRVTLNPSCCIGVEIGFMWP
ncbi:conserved hypothetical protein [Ricinus communis]|uniref:Uncharacterized protein n=1 Tax=Ricinus communis TaxID=3988 RepID=B9T2I1_RICCO|nr:conserved hypothetical protein [Ricinus communis]